MRDRDDTPYIVVERGSNGGVGSFVLGALLGAGVALLLAPRSGEETQQELRRRAIQLKDQAEDRVREVQVQLEERLEEARAELMDRVEQVREAVEAGRESAHDARVDLEERIERSKAAYRAGLEAARETAREEKGQEEA
jgi:gas vesicle protein